MLEQSDSSKLIALQLRSLNWIDRKLVLRRLPVESRVLAKKHLQELSRYSRHECKAMLKRIVDNPVQTNKQTPIEASTQAQSDHVAAVVNKHITVTDAVTQLAMELKTK